MNLYQERELAGFYNKIYAKLNHSKVFQKILQIVLDEDYISEFKSFSFIRRSDLVCLKETISKVRDSPIFLELGCGTGGLICYLSKELSGRFLGIDISSYAIQNAYYLAQQVSNSVYFICADMSKLPFSTNSIDVIFSIDAIHHAKPYYAIASEIARVLKPGGILMFSHWTIREAYLKSFEHDPLYRILQKNGLKITHINEADPGLVTQLKVYATLYDNRKQVIDELGNEFYNLLMREARIMWGHAGKVSRMMTSFSLRG